MTRGLQPLQINEYLTKKIIQDLVIECSSNTQVVISSGSAAGADDGAIVMEAASNLTLDITNVGVKNGLDTGTEASDTWYYIYLIWNPNTAEVAGLLSASATAPTLPAGFTKKRLVGAVRNEGASNFIPFSQIGANVAQNYYLLYSAVPGAGWVPINVSNYAPPTSRRAAISFGVSNNGAADSRLQGGPGTGTPAVYQHICESDLSGGATVWSWGNTSDFPMDALQRITINASNSGQVQAWMNGYTLNL